MTITYRQVSHAQYRLSPFIFERLNLKCSKYNASPFFGRRIILNSAMIFLKTNAFCVLYNEIYIANLASGLSQMQLHELFHPHPVFLKANEMAAFNNSFSTLQTLISTAKMNQLKFVNCPISFFFALRFLSVNECKDATG